MVVRSFEGCVETAGKHVLLDLPVPLLGHELLEPLGKPGKLGSREAGNNGFKFFDTHAPRIRSLLTMERKELKRALGW